MKEIYKKWWFWAIIIVIVYIYFFYGGLGDSRWEKFKRAQWGTKEEPNTGEILLIK